MSTKPPSLTQRLTRTLTQAMPALARTFQFTAYGCCPRCRLVQKIETGCAAGCNAQPRRIVEGDKDFFQPLPSKLQVIHEDPNRLRRVRIAIGFTGYALTLAGLTKFVVIPSGIGYLPWAILASSMVPIGVAMAPRFKKPPPTTSKALSAAPAVARLPAPTGNAFEGTVSALGKPVRTFLTDQPCVACELVGVNQMGQVLVRARRHSPFKLNLAGELVVVRGALDLAGPVVSQSAELAAKDIAILGIKQVDLAGIDWQERALWEGSQARVYGTPTKAAVPELAAYREEFVDVVEANHGTLVETL